MPHILGRLLLVALVAGASGLLMSRSPATARQERLSPPTPVASTGPMWMGVASCASSACHNMGEGRERKGSEYSTWSTYDKHTRAYRVLQEDRARRMAENLAPTNPGGKKIEAHKDTRCLKCHAMGGAFDNEGHAANVDTRFYLGDGVGCESCHGAAENWLGEHFKNDFRGKSAEEKERVYGLRNTKSLKSRVMICAGCHIGNADKEVDHDLIAAGHPRLSFDFSGYMALYTKHWPRAQDRERYPDYDARAWLVGQVAGAKCALELLEARAQRAEKDGGKKWPEFSEYGCYACHKSLGVSDLKEPAPPANPNRRLGAVPWGTWYYSVMPALDVRRPGPSMDLAGLAELMRQPAPNAAEVAKKAGAAARSLDPWLNNLDDWPVNKVKPCTRDETAALFKTLLTKGEMAVPALHWDDAAQLYLGLAALGRELPANPTRQEELRKLAAYLQSAFPKGVDSPKNFNPLQSPTLEERFKTLGGLVEK